MKNPFIQKLTQAGDHKPLDAEKTDAHPQFYRQEDLIYQSSFAISQVIDPEQSFSYLIEVRQPFSIVYVGFATYKHDIILRVSKVLNYTDSGSEDQIATFVDAKINCEMDPYKVLLLTEQPGIYKIEFDNSYSWYTSKLLRYRACVLSPADDEVHIRQKLDMYRRNFQKRQEQLAFSEYQHNAAPLECILYLKPSVLGVWMKCQKKEWHHEFKTDYSKESLQISSQKIESALSELHYDHQDLMTARGPRQEGCGPLSAKILVLNNQDALHLFMKNCRKKEFQSSQDIILE